MPKQLSFTYTGFKGVDSSSGVESLGAYAEKPGRYHLSVLENGRITQDGGVYTRKGIEKVATLGSDAKVDSIIGVENDAWQAMFVKSGTKIYQSKDPEDTFYTVGVARTSGETDFFFPKRKDILAINRTDNFLQVATSIIASINVAGNTLTLRTGDGDDFDTTGTFYVRGIAVTYSGKATDTLTGCTGLTAAMIAGDIVTQTTATAGNPKGTCMAELEQSGLVGGVSADPSALYWSEPSTDVEPELFYTYPVNYAVPLPRDITALKSGNDATIIGMRKGIKYSSGFEPTIGDPIIRNVSSTHSIPNAFCVDQMDEDLILTTSEGRILPAGQTDAGFKIIEDPRNPRNDMDYPVQGFLQKNADLEDTEENFIHYDPSSRISTSSIEMKEGFKKDIVLQRDIGAWSVDTGKNVSCRTVFKGKTYCGSDRGGIIYRDNSIQTDNGIAVNFRMVTGMMMLDEKRIQFDVLSVVMGGLLSAIGKFHLRLYADGGLVYNEEITAEDLIEKKLMDVTKGIPIGYGQIGHEAVGTGGEVVEGFFFTLPLEFSIECHTFQVEVQTFDPGTSLEVRELRIDIETEGEQQFNSF
jgi:hypothetical protein